ncbi:hypothetical protein MCOR27_005317 [Pyricularia oryzae]|uniref:Major facilitator superfamily (MFS) profile domain-containing protein n=1 Tax=Pyricularia grisea TaxID=148305 RepID=A0ABQ8NIP9_PYRGI|nr:hypothetical protein MCOR26_007452 [Pyricularia oryzae]KAI6296383.1 hypothetical protein MCOR33_006995 [Pyricularia grisea]KAI6279064.1 hypothetical protein MCOR27_005317 [Pyricularia oryzae]KAI6337674.1 hypothetical protein MCOR28_008377 [Pyricularia oryzae]KAI6391191.1 hypothetical protein MCOR23_009110 [Pyricularia oryzae]
MFTRLSLLGFELRVLLNRCQRRILTTMYQYSLEPQSPKMPMQTQKRVEVTTAEVVVGTTHLYRADGTIRLIPMPSPDPKDPLNMPLWRKYLAVSIVCFFGALALTAEVVVGGLIPIFILEYAGVDPHYINEVDFTDRSRGPPGSPLTVLPKGVRPPDLGRITLLVTIPLLTNGIASYFLVPLSIAVGRRPILLLASTCAWVGGLWAAMSTSLSSHLFARALQGLGAGAVEALIPLVVQDMFFLHQRNTWMSVVVSSQGLLIISVGIATPYIAANYSWRWIYWITSGFGVFAWVLLLFFMPETRFTRSKKALVGEAIYPLEEGEDRPQIDHLNYAPRTIWTEVGVFNCGFEWREAGISMLNTLRTTLFPVVIWTTLMNSAFIIAAQATQQISAFALLAQGWRYEHTGLSFAPFVVAALFVYVFAGPVADKLSLATTRWQARHMGRRRSGGSGSDSEDCVLETVPAENLREAEHTLPNFVLPFLAGIAGAFLFGASAQQNLHWAITLTGSFLIIFGYLTTLTLANVFAIESYPMWAGPVLVNVSSMRIMIAFFMASQATSWVQTKGAMATFAIYGETLIVVSLGIVVLFFFGKKIRSWTAGKVKLSVVSEDRDQQDGGNRGSKGLSSGVRGLRRKSQGFEMI